MPTEELSKELRMKLNELVWLLRGTCKPDDLFEMYLEQLCELLHLLTDISITPDELEHLMYRI